MKQKVKPMNKFKVKAARKKFAAAGVEVGDTIRVTWKIDDRYGGGIKEQVGKLTDLGHFIFVEGSNRTPGYLLMPITHVLEVEKFGE